MSALFQLYIAFITRKVVNVVVIVLLSNSAGLAAADGDSNPLNQVQTRNRSAVLLVPFKPQIESFAIPLNELTFSQLDSSSISLPLTDRFGLEYSVVHFQNYSDLTAFSITSQQDDSTKSVNRYSYAQPLVFRITIKGYSLFQSENGESYFFNFDRMKERELRKPNLLLSITKHF
jgi:hypothetical protein